MRGTGQFGNYVAPQQEDSFDKKVRQQLHVNEAPAHDTKFAETLTADKLTSIVANAAKSNSEWRAEAISKADSESFLASHPEFINTPANRAVINKLLLGWGLFNNTEYHDLLRAFEFAKNGHLLDIDKAEVARLQDHPLKTFIGLNGETYDNLGALITNNQHFMLAHMPAPTEDEEAFNDLPQEQALAVLKEGERIEQHKGEVSNTVINGQAWMKNIRPEYIDSERNGRLLAQQLKEDGVLEGEATIEQHEVAFRKIAGLLSLKPKELTKQHNEELQTRADAAKAEGGSVFDTTTEEQAELMDLDEVRRRANRVMGRG